MRASITGTTDNAEDSALDRRGERSDAEEHLHEASFT